MKNLLNCHAVGLHSFPISLENGLYKRIFYADTNHELWKPIEVAIHPHHVDIKITVLDGTLHNPMYKLSEDGEMFGKFIWNSHILNGNGGFDKVGEDKIEMSSNNAYSYGESFTMKSCELHTVFVTKGDKCVWLIEENIPSCDYFPINYSNRDLTKWTPDGLYIEAGNDVMEKYILKYLIQL